MIQNYFIHIDDIQKGPYSITELKEQNITRDTLVWFEGAESWMKANDIEDLKEIFKSIPPPLLTKAPIIPPPLSEKKTIVNTVITTEKSTNKKNIIIVVIASFLLISVIGITLYVKQQAQQTEIQLQLEKQNAKIKEQEQIEIARLAEEERQKKIANAAQRQAELEGLKSEYDQAIINLGAARINLEEVQQFHLLRSYSDKQQQIVEALSSVREWENEVNRLKRKIKQY